MKSNTLLWVVVAGIVLIGGYYMMNKPTTTAMPSPTPAPAMVQPSGSMQAMRPVTIELDQQSDLGQSGTATVSENAEGKLVVSLTLAGGTFTAPQPAHIHFGACPKPGDVKYPLTNVVSGQSVTTLDVSWADLVKAGETLAINVHKSGAESKIYTACGNIPLK
jgi:hypothetical protein